MTIQGPSRFPSYQWAWPSGDLDRLLTAALAVDETRALLDFHGWLADNDLDSATFSEHRLLAAIVERFARALSTWPEYPRLQGLQRLNWTQSRMTTHESLPAIRAMSDQGLCVVLLKGAARVAQDPSQQKSRTSYDIDILLDDADFEAAFEILAKAGWKSSRGESAMGLRGRLSTVRARNFKKGRFGDIDLHRNGYRPENQEKLTDKTLLKTVIPTDYFGSKIFIPSPEERLAMAIAHGGWDGHSHSDWLVDCSRIIQTCPVDWDVFAQIVQRRRLFTGAMIAFTYLQNHMGVPLETAFAKLTRLAPMFDGITRIPALVLAKDERTLGKPMRFLRGLTVGFRQLKPSGRNRGVDTPRIYGRIKKIPIESTTAPSVLKMPIVASITGRVHLELTMIVDLPDTRRRVEFELNSNEHNLGQFTALSLRKTKRRAILRFSGTFNLYDNETELELQALPGKFLTDDETDLRRLSKYGKIPFTLVNVKIGARYRWKHGK